ncbi:MAG TPA: ABC transporter permease, partial [Candidatus Hydrogenedentes bacterium]|nr:ABC transporter permease [Candidatus Hydrogenedentota bacterium]
EVIPLAACLVPLVNLAIGFALLGVTHLLLGGRLSAGFLAIPVVFGLELLLTLGLALWFSCGHAIFRDVGNMVAVGLMFGFYASPVIYPAELVSRATELPAWLAALYWANPMAGLLTAYRNLLFEGSPGDVRMLIWPAVCAVLVFISGLAVFRKSAGTIADSL